MLHKTWAILFTVLILSAVSLPRLSFAQDIGTKGASTNAGNAPQTDRNWPKDRRGCREESQIKDSVTAYILVCEQGKVENSHKVQPNNSGGYQKLYATLNCTLGKNAYGDFTVNGYDDGYERFNYYYYPPGGGYTTNYADFDYQCRSNSCSIYIHAQAQTGVQFTSVAVFTFNAYRVLQWLSLGYGCY